MYADKITDSMARTIEETERRRSKQIRYNREHGITPTQIARNVRNTLDRSTPRMEWSKWLLLWQKIP